MKNSGKQLIKFGKIASAVSILDEILYPKTITDYDIFGNSRRIFSIKIGGYTFVGYSAVDRDMELDDVYSFYLRIPDLQSTGNEKFKYLIIKCCMICDIPITLKVVDVKASACLSKDDFGNQD